jgi:predicted HAD superfamily Cof-like phosphohydrolase
MSQANQVREFTVESNLDKTFPNTLTPMSKEQALFITRMIMSELDELLSTVTSTSEERDVLFNQCVSTRDRCSKFNYLTQTELIAAQFDALVDSHYYSLNCAAKHGVNLDRIFDVVHQANMNKRDIKTGKFIKREDGKILKPSDWREPDIEGEIDRQIRNGAF